MRAACVGRVVSWAIGPVIDSATHRLVKKAAALSSSHTRKKHEAVLVEGAKAIADAVACGAKAQYALVSTAASNRPEVAQILSVLAQHAVPVHAVSERVFERVAQTETSQGLVVVAAEPKGEFEDLLGQPPEAPVVVLDGLQDPGNVGAVLRSASAFGFRGVVLPRGCADPFGPKVVRAAAATLFRFPIYRISTGSAEVVAALSACGYRVFAAASGGDPPEVAFRGRSQVVAIVVGSEGRGVSSEVLEASAARVWIPLDPLVESLNVAVAFGILAHSLTQTRAEVS